MASNDHPELAGPGSTDTGDPTDPSDLTDLNDRSGTAIPLVKAAHADDVVERFGVCMHLRGNVEVYNNWGETCHALDDLGVRHFRTLLSLGPDSKVIDRAQSLHDKYGMQAHFVFGKPGSEQTPAELVEAMAKMPPGAVYSVEVGGNEWNLKGSGGGEEGWADDSRIHMIDSSKVIRNHPTQWVRNLKIASYPVGNPGAWRGEGENVNAWAAVGKDVLNYVDWLNVHRYVGGNLPSSNVKEEWEWVRKQWGDAPVIKTEGGFHNAMDDTSTHKPTSEHAAGVYGDRWIMEHYRQNYRQYFIYEFADEGEYHHGQDKPDDNREKRFGLIRHDYSRKPIFKTMKHFLALMSDRGAKYNPPGLRYKATIGSAHAADFKHMLFGKRNGKHYLVLWRDISNYNNETGQNEFPGAEPVSIQLATPKRAVVYRPSKQADAMSTLPPSTKHVVDVDGHLVVMEIG